MAQKKKAEERLQPLDLLTWYAGEEVPDPITFITGEKWLNRNDLYPRQGTLIKIIFLRDDLFTDYDREVIEEWTENFKATGNNGIQPDIYERIAWCKANGYSWFREVLAVMGRRGGKGYIGALAGAYVLWNYLAKGDPQGFYGIDRSKKLTALVFAGKRDQAKQNLWRDLVNVITEAPCFAKYINRVQAESLTVFAPNDFLRMKQLESKGVTSDMDMATFEILPKESTLMAGRGPASFLQCLDPATRVLTAELEWVPIGKLSIGQKIIGVDEFAAPGQQRKFRESEIEAIWWTRKSAVRLTFEDGESVVCSPDHRWLSPDKGKGGTSKWRLTSNLTIGSKIRFFAEPWTLDSSREAGYLAGVFDGEGCVPEITGRNGSDVFFSQNEGVVLDTTLNYMRQLGFNPVPANGAAYSKSRKCQQWALRGIAENLRFLGAIRPVRLLPKADRVWAGAALRGGTSPTGRSIAQSSKVIVAIESLPAQDLVDITTTTRTFIAEGLISHNCYDEMAHVINSGSNRSAEEVFQAATPSLDQFGKDGFIYEPSSPWQMMGQFYENYVQSLVQDPVEWDEDGVVTKTEPGYPNKLMVQLASWDIYEDWERAHLIPMFPAEYMVDEYGDPICYSPKKGAVQAYDLEMQQLERANPDTFKVERRSFFATALDAYLNPQKVDAMFTGEWNGRPIVQQVRGHLLVTYKAHGDPALVNDKFGFAIAHTEEDPDTGILHCVFDLIHHWDPADFPDNTLDYIHVEKEIWGFIQAFLPDELTFDQWNSAAVIQRLQMQIREQNFPKRVQVYLKTSTRDYNFKRCENFKTALNMGWIHAPRGGSDPSVDLAINELKFLQLINGKVDHPSMGPIQSKDVADAIMECTMTLIGDQVTNFLQKGMGQMRPRGSSMGGFDPFPNMRLEDGESGLSGFASARKGVGRNKLERVQRGGFSAEGMGRARGSGRKSGRPTGNPFDRFGRS